MEGGDSREEEEKKMVADAAEEDEDLFRCCWEWDEEDIREEGLPACQQPSFEPEPEDEDGIVIPTPSYTSNDGGLGGYQRNEEKKQVEEEEASFATDFYSCGTDWSALLHDVDNITSTPITSTSIVNVDNHHRHHHSNNKRLKQTNLFQLWGFSNSISDAALATNHRLPHTCTPTPPPPNKKMKSALLFPTSSSTNATPSISGSGLVHQQRPLVCPFYKKIPGTRFTVDAFRYGLIKGCSAYFLSHFHADHYGGLSKGWSHGPIYCTSLTSSLVRMRLYVNPLFVHPLELGTEYVIDGIKVTMLEANHCPGAALIHFLLPNGQCYLHTGDFRASKLMQAYPLLTKQRINVLYLDTTYCNPKYRFPSKEDILNFVVKITKIYLKKEAKTLVIVGSYSIGKECVYLAISKALGVKIYANPSRRRTLQSFGWSDLSENLCTHGNDTPLHVLPISSLKFEILERYMKTYSNRYTAVLAFRPTGWTYTETIGSRLDLIKPSSRGIVTIYGVPYSEHSSFIELREFVQFLRPEKIIPTVNVGNASNRDKMQSYFREWLKG
ncbi:hypothetical protein RJ640_028228 [Escallonia rubra]|uniref:Metallo-beta-lactamase domain-containing protein n=1 Tax=Escallonia rubra TaxID=112253 RepID=A0AA88U3C7_9ASTE|nr:hypothetical protein RJ640_028228 [Escallonia rubra]